MGSRTGRYTPAAELGIVTTGKAYLDVREALAELGLADAAALENAGVRVLKLGMSWPLDETAIASFSRGLQTLLIECGANTVCGTARRAHRVHASKHRRRPAVHAGF